MASVWFIGARDERVISAADWASVGITGQTFRWNAENGWSHPRDSFTQEQLDVIEAQPGFDINAPNGPRTGSLVPAGTDLEQAVARILLALQVHANKKTNVHGIEDFDSIVHYQAGARVDGRAGINFWNEADELVGFLTVEDGVLTLNGEPINKTIVINDGSAVPVGTPAGTVIVRPAT